MILKPLHQLLVLTCLLLFVLSVVQADDEENDCDIDDFECLEDYTTEYSKSLSVYTSSSSSFGAPLSTVSAATTDMLSDFHEAKLVDHKSSPNNPVPAPKQDITPESTFEDPFNHDRDLDSPENRPSEVSNDKSSLSGIEAGILSACGVLVVAGIAVGIFVWRNTTRRRNIPRNQLLATDIEGHGRPGGMDTLEPSDMKPISIKEMTSISNDVISFTSSENMQSLLRQTSINLPVPAFEGDDFFSNWERRNNPNNHFQYEPKKSSPPSETIVISEKNSSLDNKLFHTVETLENIKTSITIELPEIQPILDSTDETEKVVAALLSKHNSIQKEAKATDTEARYDTIADPTLDNIHQESSNHTLEDGQVNLRAQILVLSSLDPVYDPTAITYPLQKLIQYPQHQDYTGDNLLPKEITLDLEGTEENQDVNQSENVLSQKPEQQTLHIKKQSQGNSLTSQKLSHQLHKIFQKDKNKKTNAGGTKLNIDFQQDELVRNQASSSSDITFTGGFHKLGRTLEKFAKAPLRSSTLLGKQTTQQIKFGENAASVHLHLETANAENPELDHTTTPLQKNTQKEGPAQLSIDAHMGKYQQENLEQSFASPLGLPDDQYVPLYGASGGPQLVSRAEVLADSKRRLGQDEIALWEEKCRKKLSKRLSYEMWDEQRIREEMEEYDRKHIACYYGGPDEEIEDAAVPSSSKTMPSQSQ